MDQFLRKLHETRRKSRKAAPDFLRAPAPRVPKLKVSSVQSEPSKDSIDDLKTQSQRNLLPKLSSRVYIRPEGPHSERISRPGSHGKPAQPHSARNASSERKISVALTSEAESAIVSQTMEAALYGSNPDMPQRKFYSLKALVEDILFHKEEGEEDLQFQVSLALDGLMCITKLVRKTHEDRIHLSDEAFTFQPKGSPVGTILMVKLLGSRPRGETQELGMALVDLSTIPVGGSTAKVLCKLSNHPERMTRPEVTLKLKICARRKSFTFSYLKADPVFRKAGYEVTADGLCGFPQPYKKAGLPEGVKFSSLVLNQKVSEDVVGLEVYKAFDANGNQYTVQKYNIMDTACRELLVSELDGLTDMMPGQGMTLCDAFLESMNVCVVLDVESGTMLREALTERGALPEMVTSIVLRQVLQALRFMHETRSRLHNDIDARNVLCLRTGEVRLGGFNYSMKLVGKASKFSGRFVHMAPERLLGLECSFAADVWSIGILAAELALGRCPYDLSRFSGPNALFEFKRVAVLEPSPSLRGLAGCSDELRSFVDQCLHRNLRHRASPPELLAHPFIARYESFLLPAGSWLTKKPPHPSASPARNPAAPDAAAPGQHHLPSPSRERRGSNSAPGRRGSVAVASPGSKMSS